MTDHCSKCCPNTYNRTPPQWPKRWHAEGWYVPNSEGRSVLIQPVDARGNYKRNSQRLEVRFYDMGHDENLVKVVHVWSAKRALRAMRRWMFDDEDLSKLSGFYR